MYLDPQHCFKDEVRHVVHNVSGNAHLLDNLDKRVLFKDEVRHVVHNVGGNRNAVRGKHQQNPEYQRRSTPLSRHVSYILKLFFVLNNKIISG